MAGYLSWLTGGRSFKLQVRQRWRKRGNYEKKKKKKTKKQKIWEKTAQDEVPLYAFAYLIFKRTTTTKKAARKQRKTKMEERRRRN
jgi:hypothetical protein